MVSLKVQIDRVIHNGKWTAIKSNLIRNKLFKDYIHIYSVYFKWLFFFMPAYVLPPCWYLWNGVAVERQIKVIRAASVTQWQSTWDNYESTSTQHTIENRVWAEKVSKSDRTADQADCYIERCETLHPIDTSISYTFTSGHVQCSFITVA